MNKTIVSTQFIEAFFRQLEIEYDEEMAGYSKDLDVLGLCNKKHIGLRAFAESYIDGEIERLEEEGNGEEDPYYQQLFQMNTDNESQRLMNCLQILENFHKEEFSSNQSYNHYKYQFFLVKFQLETETAYWVIGIHIPFFGRVVYSPRLSFERTTSLEEGRQLFMTSINNHNVFGTG